MLFKAESKNTNCLLLWVRQLHYAASRYLKIKNHRSSKLRIAVPRMIVCLWTHPEISVVLIGKTPLNFGNTLRYLRAVHINKCKYVLLCFRTHLRKAVLVSTVLPFRFTCMLLLFLSQELTSQGTHWFSLYCKAVFQNCGNCSLSQRFLCLFRSILRVTL